MRSSQDPEADRVQMREGFRLPMAAATFGGVVLIVAGMIGALVAADQRAMQAFKAEPRTARVAASPRVGTPPVPRQTSAGETGLAPDATLDVPQSVDDNSHYGRRKQGRRYAQWHARRPDSGLFGLLVGR